MKDEEFIFIKIIICAFLLSLAFFGLRPVNAARVSILTQGVVQGGASTTVYNQSFISFSQVSNGQFQLMFDYTVPSSRYFSISGYLLVENKSSSDGIAFNDLALTTLTNACKVDYTKEYQSVPGEEDSRVIRDGQTLYYFECNHVSYNVDHSIRFELLGYYPDILGRVYIYDWVNFSYDDSQQSIIDNQNKNQAQTNSRLDSMNTQQRETNSKLEDMMESDISSTDKELPDNSSYTDYSESEQDLLDKTKEADLDTLDVGLDVQTSSWIWDTLTRLIQSNSVVFGMIIAILSIGVIKLALGR